MRSHLRSKGIGFPNDPGITDAKRVVDCLKPFDATLMKKYPVSTRVNRPENDDQECATEIPIAGPALRLF